MTNSLTWLLNWYQSQCDSDWEHIYCIDIRTVDNPGWWIDIDIAETELENCSFELVEADRSEEDWFFSKVENNKFRGSGGIHNFMEVLDIFKAWATSVNNPDETQKVTKLVANNSFTWLLNWYESQCDGDWEHTYWIKMETIDNPGWWIYIEVAETELEDRSFEVVKVNRSEEDWLFCKVENNKFEGSGGIHNFMEILDTFKAWATSVNNPDENENNK